MWFVALERPLAVAQLVVVMFAMGSHLDWREFSSIVRRPTSLLFGLCCQWILAPAIAVAVARWFDLPSEIQLGLFVVCAMPGGPMSALFTHLAGGRAALSVALTVATTLLAVVVSPLLLSLLSSVQAGGEFFPAGRRGSRDHLLSSDAVVCGDAVTSEGTESGSGHCEVRGSARLVALDHFRFVFTRFRTDSARRVRFSNGVRDRAILRTDAADSDGTVPDFWLAAGRANRGGR